MIQTEHLDLLHKKGLITSTPFPKEHGWENGIRIGKPSNVTGNYIPNHSYKFMGQETDAPTIVLFAKDNKWIVLAQDFNPTKGPGDFKNVWNTLEEALEDILEFYFGDPSRMMDKAKNL